MRRLHQSVAFASLILLINLTLGTPGATADDGSEIASGFKTSVAPLLQKYCIDCHGKDDPAAMFDLSRFRRSDDVSDDLATWQHVVDRMEAGEMPPEDAEQPTDQDRQELLEWSRSLRQQEANRNAGDPGTVLARRLSAAELNHTVRDLTGVDIRPARHFPVDRANQDGFANSGESLEMTPGLMMKYLDAAQLVSHHLILEPDGLRFAPHPVMVDTDRDKYCVRRIVEFYDRQNTELADYFLACWRLRQTRASDDDFEKSIERIAREGSLSPKYLQTIWELLTGDDHHLGPIARLRSTWRALPQIQHDPQPGGDEPQPGGDELRKVQVGCERMSESVAQLRPRLAHRFPHLSHRGINNGSQPFVLWRNRQYATHRRSLNRDVLVEARTIQAHSTHANDGQGNDGQNVEKGTASIDLKRLETELRKLFEEQKISRDDLAEKLKKAKQAMSREAKRLAALRSHHGDLVLPEETKLREQHIAALEKFCDVFPDQFFVRSRGREFKGLPGEQYSEEAQLRLLSAGFHSQMGFFRDDAPLYDLLLDEEQQKELDQLWLELDFIADVSRRQHQGFIWYERGESRFLTGPEFDFARGEDEDITSPEKILRLSETYLAKAERTGASDAVMEAIADHFRRINLKIRSIESLRTDAEAKHIVGLLDLATRAYRRPLTESEASKITGFYDKLKSDDGLNHEDAVRDVVVLILASPHFCYRTQPSDRDEAVHPLSQYALASRLSYFLWSSAPDDALLASAAKGELDRKEVLVAHVRRMVADDRIRGFAEQFAGNWLGYAGFEDHKGVDRHRFPQFDDELRRSMFQEPTEFFVDLLRRDGSILELLDGDHTFVNRTLARHYGIDADSPRPGQWTRVDDAGRYGRGGILAMSVFMTSNAHALRTSPVQRGYWVARQLLGERIPPPPAEVPELPQDEAELGDATLAETLARHREHSSCAGCHDRFDSLGITLEEFDPIGRRRHFDGGGRSIQTKVNMPDGVERQGVDGLRDYLREHRHQDFVDNACRKLLAYGLGRSLIIADDIVLDSMQGNREQRNHAIRSMIETIVTSPPFLNQRGRGDGADRDLASPRD